MSITADDAGHAQFFGAMPLIRKVLSPKVR